MSTTFLFGDLMFSGLPTTVAVAAVGAFAYLAGLMSRLDEAPPERLQDVENDWQDDDWAEMTDEVLAVTRKALNDSRRLTQTVQNQ